MSEIPSNQIKAISKSNFFWGVLNSLIVFPLFIYTSAFVLYHEDNGQLHLNEYGLKFLLEPTVFFLLVLVVMNTVADLWVYKSPKKAVLKMGLMVLNLTYLLFMIAKGFVLKNGIGSYVILSVLLFILIYKLFRYRTYYNIARGITETTN